MDKNDELEKFKADACKKFTEWMATWIETPVTGVKVSVSGRPGPIVEHVSTFYPECYPGFQITFTCNEDTRFPVCFQVTYYGTWICDRPGLYFNTGVNITLAMNVAKIQTVLHEVNVGSFLKDFNPLNITVPISVEYWNGYGGTPFFNGVDYHINDRYDRE